MEYELAGVVRYIHCALMVTGPNRIPIVQFLKDQATKSLLHSQEKLHSIELRKILRDLKSRDQDQ